MKIFTVIKITQEGNINESKSHSTLESANRHALSICEEIHGEVFKDVAELNEYQDMLLEGGFDTSLIRVLETDISIPQIQNTFKQYSEEFAKICGVSSIESIAGTVYEKLFLLSLKNISKIEQKPSPAVDARDLFSQIEKLAIEAGVVESKGKMFLGFFKSGGAKQKDVLLHLNGVDSGNNGCYYIDTEEFQDENNESGLKELVDKAGKFGISRIEIY